MVQNIQDIFRARPSSSFLYFCSVILRDVIRANRVGIVSDDQLIKKWFDQNKFEVIFEFSRDQIFNIEIPFESKIAVEVFIGFDIFSRFEQNKIDDILVLLFELKKPLILANVTSENHKSIQKVKTDRKTWRKNLSKIGNVIEVYRHDQYDFVVVI